jgi:hypothetical protein
MVESLTAIVVVLAPSSEVASRALLELAETTLDETVTSGPLTASSPLSPLRRIEVRST